MNKLERALRVKENQIEFDMEGEKKGDPIHIWGKIYNQFQVSGHWLKGNFHCHLREDRWNGNSENALDFYSDKGYDFIGGMEHDDVFNLQSRDDIKVIPGMEVSPGHFLAYDLEDFSFPEVEGDRVTRMAQQIKIVKERGGLAILAHPVKSRWSWSELKKLYEAGLSGIEVVNSNVRGKVADTGRADQIWKLLLQENYYLLSLGNDDAHGPHENLQDKAWKGVSQVGWTGVLAEDINEEEILKALREARTYASEGPEIKTIKFNPDGKLIVECSPCVACHFRGMGSYGGTSTFPSKGEGTGKKFVLDLATGGYRIKKYIVVILQDKWGRRAWSSPIPVDINYELT